MDYLVYVVMLAIANVVLAVLNKTVLSKLLGSKVLLKLGNSSIEFLRAFDRTDARQLIAIIFFLIFSIVVIKKYREDSFDEKDGVGLTLSIIAGIAQLWFMINYNF